MNKPLPQKTNIHPSKGLRSETTLMPWLIWGLAALFYAYEFLQRVSISIYWPHLIRELGTDASGIGVMSAFFYYAYASMQIPAGILVDWLGAKRLATLGILLVAIGTFLFGTIHSVAAGSIARFIIGLGSAFAFICCLKFIILWFPPYRFALLAGMTNLAGYLGATLGETPLTVLVSHYGWRKTTFILALLGLLIAALIIIIIKDKPFSERQHRRKAGHKKEVETPHIFEGLKRTLARGRNWVNGLYAGLMMGPTSAFAALWGVNFLTRADSVTRQIAGGAISAIFIGVAIGSPLFGWYSDRIGKRQPLLIFAAAGSMCATLFLIYMNNISLTVIYTLCFLFGFFQSAHVLNFAIAKDYSSKKHSGTAMGFVNMAATLGGAVLQPTIGFLLDWSRHGSVFHGAAVYTRHTYHVALVAIPISQLTALLIAIFLLKDKK